MVRIFAATEATCGRLILGYLTAASRVVGLVGGLFTCKINCRNAKALEIGDWRLPSNPLWGLSGLHGIKVPQNPTDSSCCLQGITEELVPLPSPILHDAGTFHRQETAGSQERPSRGLGCILLPFLNATIVRRSKTPHDGTH
jgi:hypothetical protein